ncbi:MAG: serine/threonine-protein kinase [Myxococcaceae bacterium]
MAPDAVPARKFLGRYELVDLLGKGGMGEVWLAKLSGAAGFEKPCIVKTVLPELAGDQSFIDRFHHEAKVLVHLVHSNIAQVFDMGESDGILFMALEFVPGVDLATLVAQVRKSGRPLPLPIALHLAQKVAEGLAYAHRKVAPDGRPLNVVHRDVSPHNVMVSYEGEVKVIDFGLAKSAAKSKQTQQATVMGKLGYMSPEQVRALPLDARTDIYSCGVMLWEMLAGRPLVDSGTVGEMMAAMAYPKVPSLRGMRPDVDGPIEAVVIRALSAEVATRYAKADELVQALSAQLMRLGTPVGSEEVGAFVRAECPEAFAAQQRIISRLSTVNAPLKLDHAVAVIESTTVRAVTGVEPLDPPVVPGQVPSFLLDTAPSKPASAPPVPTRVARQATAPASPPPGLVAPAPAPASPPPSFHEAVARAPAPAPGPGHAEPASPPPPIASAPSPAPSSPPPSAPSPASQPSQLMAAELAAVRPSRGPLVVVLALLGVLVVVGGGVAGALWYLKRQAVAVATGPDGLFGAMRPTTLSGPVAVVAPTGGDPAATGGTAAPVAPSGLFVEAPAEPAAPVGADAGAGEIAEAPAPPVAVAAADPVPPAPSGPVEVAAADPALTAPPFAPLPYPDPKARPKGPAKGKGALKGTALFDTTGRLPSVTLVNADAKTWSNCQVILPGRYVHKLVSLAPGFRRELPFKYFTVDASVADVAHAVQVKCKQGSTQFAAPF